MSDNTIEQRIKRLAEEANAECPDTVSAINLLGEKLRAAGLEKQATAVFYHRGLQDSIYATRHNFLRYVKGKALNPSRPRINSYLLRDSRGGLIKPPDRPHCSCYPFDRRRSGGPFIPDP